MAIPPEHTCRSSLRFRYAPEHALSAIHQARSRNSDHKQLFKTTTYNQSLLYHSKSYRAQSYINTQRLCCTKVHLYTINKLDKDKGNVKKVRLYGTSEGNMWNSKSYIDSETVPNVWSADWKRVDRTEFQFQFQFISLTELEHQGKNSRTDRTGAAKGGGTPSPEIGFTRKFLAAPLS